ncbi:MAG: ADP-ribosyl-[dinitrogen reductase] hydrolase [Nitrospiria bacterium]
MTLNSSELKKRALASYFGLAIGDALGATTEFMRPGDIRAKYGVHRNMIGGGWLCLAPGQITDDTEMSLALGEALLESGGMDLNRIALKFISWMQSNPVDIGATVRRGLQRIIATGQLKAEFSESAAGNGAAMRNLPVILATLASKDDFCNWSISQSHLTHNHPEADIGILILGDLTRRALLSGLDAPLQTLANEWITRFPKFDYCHNRRKTSGYIVHTVQNVLDFFFSTADFESCLMGVVNCGGDADTNGALAGMLAGAFYGLESIPKRWLNRLDPKARQSIARQVESLLELFSPGVKSREFEKDSPLLEEYIRSLI